VRSTNRISRKPSRRLASARRVAITGAGAALIVVMAATAAGAHVTVHSKDAKPGGKDATLVFKVPNEESNAKTTKIEIDFPAATPLTGIVAQTPAGWSADTTADKVVFSGGAISGDDSVEFPIKVAQLPNVDKIVFKALQTYSNGDIVRWIELAAAGGQEPAHPAPVLDLKNPSKLSADEIADAKEDAEKDAKAAAGKGAKPDAAGAKPDAAGAKSDAAKPAAGAAGAPTAVHAGTGGQAVLPAHGGPGDAGDPASPSMPAHVHAGSGGQAAQQAADETPVAPLSLVLLGLGVAGLAVRRLTRS
jgi:uncharacterized protein YcnI